MQTSRAPGGAAVALALSTFLDNGKGASSTPPSAEEADSTTEGQLLGSRKRLRR